MRSLRDKGIVEITDVNDHFPSFPEKEQTFEIFEQTLPGRRFQLHAARDPDAGIYSIRTYTLTANDYFEVDIRQSDEDKIPFLVLKKSVDREQKNKHALLVTAVDGGKPPKSGTLNVSIIVLDSNDNRPMFSKEIYQITIPENVVVGTSIFKINATDADEGTNSEIEYSLGKTLKKKVYDIFELDKLTGELRVKAVVDYEENDVYKLDVEASDKGTPPLIGECRVIIKIKDVNDNAPEIDVTSLSNIVSEDSKPGTVISLLSAVDKDYGVNGKIITSITSDVPFELKPSYKENIYSIVTKGFLDREKVSHYEITIKATDCGEPPLSTVKTLSIQISDVNDNSPHFDQNPLQPGTTVALISVNDLDSGLNGKVICSIVEDVPFALSPSLQDKMYSLVTKSPLDRERKSTYDVTIIAKDAGQPSLSSAKTISVVVSDVNDNRPEFSLSPYTFYVTEANEPGASVFSVKAFDRDETENALISYHILRDGSKDNTFTSFVNINTESGDILALKSFDFETLKTFQFQVVASDSGTPPLSSNVTVNVFILDQNDNAPVILYPVIRAYDADIGYNGWLLFSLQEVTDHSLFGLDRYTGQIRTLRSFTETDEAEHKLVILVKDNGNVSLSATATVIVKVVEPKEAFAASDVKSATKDEEDNNVTFYLMITLGSVSTLFLINYTSKYLQETNYDGTLSRGFRIVSGSTEPLFQVNRNDGILYVNRNIDREEICQRTSACLINLKTVLENPLEIHYVAVEVLDVNDHSPSFPEDNKRIEISESTLPGTRFQLHAALDPDGGVNSVQQYKLSPNNNFH
uniref:Si:ch73-379j16.2 n=1 Tax=Cyclopterus lumpus TaxID=8103 RepID=A0A8C3A1V8_CYCLU